MNKPIPPDYRIVGMSSIKPGSILVFATRGGKTTSYNQSRFRAFLRRCDKRGKTVFNDLRQVWVK